VKAFELEEAKASNLNSGDCFLLLAKDTAFLWKGVGTNEKEVDLGIKLLEFYGGKGRAVVHVNEESEPEDFWTTLGGKEEYPRVKNTGMTTFDPRLFHCSNATGYFQAEEIQNFTQNDLMNDDVMIMDNYDEVYVWIGKGSTSFEVKQSSKLAEEYLEKCKDGRDLDIVSITQLMAGGEPPQFTKCFPSWDSKLAELLGADDPFKQARMLHDAALPAEKRASILKEITKKEKL
jgi:hypothetical protein